MVKGEEEIHGGGEEICWLNGVSNIEDGEDSIENERCIRVRCFQKQSFMEVSRFSQETYMTCHLLHDVSGFQISLHHFELF